METMIQSLSDFILAFLYRARNHLTRIASYVRMMMTKLCIKIHMKSDSAIESAFPYYSNTYAFADPASPFAGPGTTQKFSQIHRRHAKTTIVIAK